MQLDDEIVLRFRLGCVLVAGVDRMKPKAKAQVKISQGSRKKITERRKAKTRPRQLRVGAGVFWAARRKEPGSERLRGMGSIRQPDVQVQCRPGCRRRNVPSLPFSSLDKAGAWNFPAESLSAITHPDQ
jgi:hypothetical protein